VPPLPQILLHCWEVGKGKLNGTYICNKIDPGYWSPKWQALVETYKAEHPGQALLVNTAPNFYDALYAVKAAFETLNITGDKSKLAEERKKTAEFLHSSKEFDGIQGKFKWPPDTGTMSWWTVKKVYSWSKDNSKELAKGWIVQADTIAELARKINKDPGKLEATLKQYNEFCAAGMDPQFGRPKTALLPVSAGPFYAMELMATFTNTQGGPRRNKEARVLDTMGKPIPRLYSGGELGSMYSHCYNGGGNIGECMAFGRIAGENAAAEKPWA